MLNYAEITDRADRRHTKRLLSLLAKVDLAQEERRQVVRALQALSDPRSFGRLEAMVCDHTRPASVREAASSVLRGLHELALDAPEEKLRLWWREGDEVLRRHALRSMSGICCPGIVLAVASDVAHPLQADALNRMDWWFSQPEHQAVKIAGLSHRSAEVREVAAHILLWDEPIAAEEALIAAAHDPVPEVAGRAINTLQYYASQRVLLCLRGLLRHPNALVREQAEESYGCVQGDFLWPFRRPGANAEYLRRWMGPVWDALGFTEEEVRGNEEPFAQSAPRADTTTALPVDEMLGLLADAEESPLVLRERMQSADWEAYREDERRRLRPVLLAHPDQLVRYEAASAFAAWEDAEGLVGLLRENDFGVRKHAMYLLGQLPPTPSLADIAWEHLKNEGLRVFVRHAERAVAVRRLAEIAGDVQEDEGLRDAALDQLERMGALEEVSRLASILHEPPGVTWALHIGWLEAARRHRLPVPPLGHLREVDNVGLQEALSAFP